MIPARRFVGIAIERWPRSLALGIGGVASLTLLLALEGAVRVLGLGAEPPMQLRGGCRASGTGGAWSRPDCDEEFARFEGRKALFRVRVSTDSSGRRRVPGQVETAGSQVVFFGCSYTWGWGLQGEQTLPAVFQGERPDVSAWNLAWSGLGPHDALVQMEQAESTLRGVDRTRPARAVFVMIADHLARVAGDAYYVRTWGARHPRFVLDSEGTLHQRGVFYDDPLRRWVTQLQNRSRLSRALAPRLRFVSDAYRVDLTVAVLGELRRRFAQRFPGGDLTVVLFPDLIPARVSAFTGAARAKGLAVLDYSSLPRTNLSPEDAHPDADTVARVARALARDLPAAPAEGHD